MKAAVLHGPGDLRLQDYPDPFPTAREVLVRISRNGLCGSDLHFYERGELGPFRVSEPYIPGHEASGVVIEAARCGAGPREGTRVAIEPGIPCRQCEWCHGGRYNLCPDVVFMSAPPVNGTLAELVAAPWDFVHPLPECVDDELGAFVEPLSVAVQACRRGAVGAGSRAAVLGAGPIGLVTCLVARAFGVVTTIVVDVLQPRLDLALEIGATHTLLADKDARSDLGRQIRDLTDGRGADVVIDTTGSAEAAAQAPLLATRGGSVVQVGWPERAEVAYPLEKVIEKELDVVGVNRYCNTYPTALGLLESGLVNPRLLISHRFPFSDVVEAVEFSAHHRRETMKVMIESI